MVSNDTISINHDNDQHAGNDDYVPEFIPFTTTSLRPFHNEVHWTTWQLIMSYPLTRLGGLAASLFGIGRDNDGN